MLNPLTGILEGLRLRWWRGTICSSDHGDRERRTARRSGIRGSSSTPRYLDRGVIALGARDVPPAAAVLRRIRVTIDTDVAIGMDAVWKKFHRGERHDSLRDLIPPSRGDSAGCAAGEPSSGRRLLGAARCVLRGEARRRARDHRTQRRRQVDTAQDSHAPSASDARQYVTHGRIGALIEVTAGFHPDLTGRENIFLNGSIIGMKRRTSRAASMPSSTSPGSASSSIRRSSATARE